MRIAVDTREKRPFTFYDFADMGVSIVRKKLVTGDYSLEGMEDLIAIERKQSVAEIANNVVERRFDNWTARLSQIPHAYIICEFPYSNILTYPRGSEIPYRRWKHLRVRPPFIIKRLKEVEDMGINIIYAGSRSEAELEIVRILREVTTL